MTYLPELLVVMHAAAVELEASNLLEHHWGLHLLSDWKSLMLLAEHAYDEPEPIEAPHALQPTP